MPKETFYNLKEDKRKRIEKAGISEFANQGFKGASINRIISQAGISKGSYYQYFDHKKDLFRYLLHRMGEEKIHYMSPLLKNPESLDFFTLLRELYLAGLRFAQDRPDLVKIGNRIINHRHDGLYKDILEDTYQTSDVFFKDLLLKAEARGEIRSGLDLDLAADMMTQMHVTMVEYHMQKNKSLVDDSLLETVDHFLNILKEGMINKDSKGGRA